jgi:subtilisin family serine protease
MTHRPVRVSDPDRAAVSSAEVKDIVAIRRHDAEAEDTWRDPGWKRRIYEYASRGRYDAGLAPFAILDDDRGQPVFVGDQELLLLAGDLDDRARRLIEAAGLSVQPVSCLRDRVVRLVKSGATGPELAELAARLRGDGVPASATYVPPMSIVMKSRGGAEPAHRRWEDYRPPARPGRVRVSIVDTGVTAQRRTDGWLDGLEVHGIDQLDLNPKNGKLDMAAGHGTAVMGIVRHAAPEATIAVHRAAPPDGSALETEVACGMVEAVEAGFEAGQAVVLNLSLGTTTVDGQSPLALQAALDLIEEMAAESPDRDVLVVAAAGNFGDTRPVWPAASPGVIAVGALGQDLLPTVWSSRGPWVDCSVVGDGVLSVYVEGEEDPYYDRAADSFPADSWALHFGTSFAAPQIAGAVARIAQDEGVSLRDALTRLLTGARRIRDFGRVPDLRMVRGLQAPVGG